MKKQTINIKPTMAQAMSVYIQLLCMGNKKAKKEAAEILMELAKDLDAKNEIKEISKAERALILIGRAAIEIKRLEELEDETSERADNAENSIFKDLQSLYDYESDDNFQEYNLQATGIERLQKLMNVLTEFYGL